MRLSRILAQATASRSTGVFGLKANENPKPLLLSLYTRILHVMERQPPTSIYRQSVEAITKHRVAILESTEDIKEMEERIDAGLIEEVVLQAEDELALASKMNSWKPWENLETPPPAGQWEK